MEAGPRRRGLEPVAEVIAPQATGDMTEAGCAPSAFHEALNLRSLRGDDLQRQAQPVGYGPCGDHLVVLRPAEADRPGRDPELGEASGDEP